MPTVGEGAGESRAEAEQGAPAARLLGAGDPAGVEVEHAVGAIALEAVIGEHGDAGQRLAGHRLDGVAQERVQRAEGRRRHWMRK
ncbi:hypothetical protein OV142_21050 [Nannocystis sp. SCPEA4]|nr:hypothetical protein [Nannocystis sp. SCPEA4]MCY1057596.1 hypothetical protein [Nannocystis sp. SCPEA4]